MLKEKRVEVKAYPQVHDELILESDPEEKDEANAVVKECMENAARLLVPLTVDINSGYNWYEAK